MSEKTGKRKRNLSIFIQNLYCRFMDDEVTAMGAQLTYYLILAFFPFLLFLVSIVSFTPLTTVELLEYLSRMLPEMSDRAILSVIDEIKGTTSESLLSIGLVAALWSASAGVNAIIKALNRAYDVEEDRPFWKVRGISLLFTVFLTVVIMLTLVMLIFGKYIGNQLFIFLEMPASFDTIWGLAQICVPLVIMAIVFTMLYAYTPNLRLSIREVIPGALVATVGWVTTSVLFSFYVNQFANYSKTYGSIGGVIVFLIWLYLSSIIVVFGGEVNATLYFDEKGKRKASCKTFSFKFSFRKKSQDNKRIPSEILPLYPTQRKQ